MIFVPSTYFTFSTYEHDGVENRVLHDDANILSDITFRVILEFSKGNFFPPKIQLGGSSTYLIFARTRIRILMRI